MKALTGGLWQERKEVGRCRVCSGRKSSKVSQRSVREAGSRVWGPSGPGLAHSHGEPCIVCMANREPSPTLTRRAVPFLAT